MTRVGGASALVARDTGSLAWFVKPRASARAQVIASVSSLAVGLGLGVALIASGVAADTPHRSFSAPAPSVTIPVHIIAPAPAETPALTPAIAIAPVQPRDLDCLTAAVYYEARGEAVSGQAAVAQVVLNRVGDPAFAGSVCGVVYQGANRHACQFSWACHGEVRRRHEDAAWSQARFVAARALNGYVMGEVSRATYFHVASLGQVWGRRMAPVAHVGHHIFYAPGGHRALAHAYRTLQVSAKRSEPPAGNGPALRGPETAQTTAPATVQTTATRTPAPPTPQTAS